MILWGRYLGTTKVKILQFLTQLQLNSISRAFQRDRERVETGGKNSYLFNPVQLEIRIEELPQHGNVKQVPADTVMLRNRVSELHALIVRRPINPLIIKQVAEILVQEIHQFLSVKCCGL